MSEASFAVQVPSTIALVEVAATLGYLHAVAHAQPPQTPPSLAARRRRVCCGRWRCLCKARAVCVWW